MKLDAKLKGGLAWAGLVVILAVPSADILLGKSNGSATANTASVATPTKTAVTKPVLAKPQGGVDPIETASLDGKDPVKVYIDKGKKLPSYISDADSASATPVKTAPATTDAAKPAEVASVSPNTETPPVPMPRSARPKWTNTAATPAEEKPLIIDESKVAAVAPEAPVEPFPLSDTEQAAAPEIGSDQLEEWDSGSLADYLARKGLLSDNSASQSSSSDDADIYIGDPEPKTRARPLEDFFLF